MVALVWLGQRLGRTRMVRSLARQRSFQLPASVAETRMAIRQRRLLVALRSMGDLVGIPVDVQLLVPLGVQLLVPVDL